MCSQVNILVLHRVIGQVPLKRWEITILLLFHIFRLNENMNFFSEEGLSSSNFNVQFLGLGILSLQLLLKFKFTPEGKIYNL